MPDRPPYLDHVVLAGPSLAAAVDWFTDLTGIVPASGGSHPGWGTANRLVGLGGDAYLEIIGPDPDQPDPSQPRPFRIDELAAPRVITWAMHPPDLDAAIAAARALGYDPGDAQPMSRQAPGGDVVRWRLTDPDPDLNGGGLLPFLIDWGDTPHPTNRDLPGTPLISLRGRHPDPGTVQLTLAALGTALEVLPGPVPGLELVLTGPAGPIKIA